MKRKKRVSVCLAFMFAFFAVTSFSGCDSISDWLADGIVEVMSGIVNDIGEALSAGRQIELQKRENRINAVSTEVDYDYAVFD